MIVQPVVEPMEHCTALVPGLLGAGVHQPQQLGPRRVPGVRQPEAAVGGLQQLRHLLDEVQGAAGAGGGGAEPRAARALPGHILHIKRHAPPISNLDSLLVTATSPLMMILFLCAWSSSAASWRWTPSRLLLVYSCQRNFMKALAAAFSKHCETFREISLTALSLCLQKPAECPDTSGSFPHPPRMRPASGSCP